MGHVHPSHLVELALGHPSGDTDGGDLRHLAACPRCRDELARMTRVVTAARGARASDLSTAPPGHLWQRIAQEALREPDGPPGSDERSATARARGVRHRWTTVTGPLDDIRALVLTAAARLVRWSRISPGRVPARRRRPPWRRHAR
ncbi:hypothetical protein [Streptomyces flavalbus]|uniref:Zinc-finger domain-containing protein n=1 Tax=Streptomyces flavalbus TaxID=2665155 RepID=A0ABW2WHY4_9ACTN